MERDLIYDVGMNEGEDTEYYLAKGFRVVAVEADVRLCERVGNRLAARVSSGQLTIVNAAIAETDGPVGFFLNENLSDWNTADPHMVERNRRMGAPSRRVEVPGRSMAGVLAEHGVPYFLKIDIEGHDMICLRGLQTVESRPRHVSMESDKVSWRGLLEEFDLFRDLGYDRFKVVNQARVPHQVCPDPGREGQTVAWHFEHGSSGLFGEETPGRWLTRAAALRRYRWVFARYRAVGNTGLIPNLHRRFAPGSRLKSLTIPGWHDTHATRSG